MQPDGSASYEELTTRISRKELSTLLKVSNSLASTMQLGEVLQIAIESATELLGINSGAIYTLENEALYLGATTPALPEHFPEELRSARLQDHPHIHAAVSSEASVFVEDARLAPLSDAEKTVIELRQLVSILYFPLLLKGRAIGVFILGTTGKPRRFTGSEIDLCHLLASHVALAVANAQLYQKAQRAVTDLIRAYEATLEGWSRMLDLRDHVTDEHTRRVMEVTVTLARKMGVSEAELGHIRRGALLHDIGKIAISDAILQKPEGLSENELPVMQTHPETAYEILSHIDYLAPALSIPYCHHEKWDGTGYPRGLKGEQIPLAARIFAVVDVFDALTSDRPYRKAWTKEAALDHIRSQSGRHFDPAAVEAFLELVEQDAW